ncbi:hypothetical protein QFZ34_002007 [Phyllobacterium ifriqiyense]|uniref:Uncharacterized protein n=1 Tax=Phyllobacterium ifriqiyense TaxID=314238 RepID=A0ABU0S7W3_9HYPH|nr:hypothetical protein [Phyllobacterium ifriqiyense]MDQ0996825.1 hypothetical protein [Phyllobacterium ifriqiyense]
MDKFVEIILGRPDLHKPNAPFGQAQDEGGRLIAGSYILERRRLPVQFANLPHGELVEPRTNFKCSQIKNATRRFPRGWRIIQLDQIKRQIQPQRGAF